MGVPVEVAFRNLSPIDWAEAEIRRRAYKLAAACRDLQSCRVLVEIPHRHHVRGNRFHIRIDLTVPGEDIAVSRAPDAHALLKHHEEPAREKRMEIEADRKDGHLVIRKAFDAARRQLQEYARRRRHEVKTHD